MIGFHLELSFFADLAIGFDGDTTTGCRLRPSGRTRNANPNHLPSHWCPVSTRILLWSIAVALGAPAGLQAQAVSGWAESSRTIRQVPAPVRRTPAPQGKTAPRENTAPLDVAESRSNRVNYRLAHQHTPAGEIHAAAVINGQPIRMQSNPQLQPHQLLVPPGRQAIHDQRKSHGTNWLHQHLHHKHHAAAQPPTALLPEANSRPTWKTPYSYGYFGASRSRHWTVHYGYRDRMTEWRLR